MGEQRLLHPKQLRYPAGGLADQGLVLLPALHVLLQQGQCTRCRGSANGAGQLHQIAHGQVETLPRYRVQGMGSIAHHHPIGNRLGTGMGQHQRVTLAFADTGQPRRIRRALLLQPGKQCLGLHGHPGIHLITGAGPNQGKTAIRQRQQGQGPIVEETLVGNALVIAGQGQIGNHGIVAGVAAPGTDPQPFAGP